MIMIFDWIQIISHFYQKVDFTARSKLLTISLSRFAFSGSVIHLT